MFQAASGYDEAESYSRNVIQAPPWHGLAGLTVGVPAKEDRIFDGSEDSEVVFEKAVATLAKAGMTIRELPFTDLHAIAKLLYEGPWVAERYAAIRPLIEKQPEALHPVTREIIEKARGFSAADAFSAEYALCDLRRRVAPLLASVDLLCVPTAPRNATVKQVLADPVGVNSMLGT